MSCAITVGLSFPPRGSALGCARSGTWSARGSASEHALVFARDDGSHLDRTHLHRVVRAAGRRTGVPWVGLHTLRHTAATLAFRSGWNAKQVQARLGHHSPAFTLATYVHTLPDDLPEPKFVDFLDTTNMATIPLEEIAAERQRRGLLLEDDVPSDRPGCFCGPPGTRSRSVPGASPGLLATGLESVLPVTSGLQSGFRL